MTGDYTSIGEAAVKLFWVMVIALCIFVPLGIWKLVEIIIWCSKHFHITFQ